MKIREGIRYKHYRTKYDGAVTVAYETTPNKNKDNVHLCIGLAWCSPRDQFCRAKGRLIAEGRLKSDKSCIGDMYERKILEEQPVQDVVFSLIETHASVPNWYILMKTTLQYNQETKDSNC